MKNYEYLYYVGAKDIKRMKRQKVMREVLRQTLIIIVSYNIINLILAPVVR
jgi:hypothetical protein